MIVVGVDGSECSRSALRFALEEARMRKTPLRIIVAWHVPLAAYGAGLTPPPPHLAEDAEAGAKEVLEEALAATREDAASVDIETAMVEGHAAGVLIEESEQAELLVVGSRGRGGIRELVLGSISHECVMKAHCPVAVVRAGCEGEAPASAASAG